jgi:CheY-like chemotaxis protein
VLALKSAPSRERLLHEASICLHRPERAFSVAQRQLLAEVAQHPPELAGARVLLVDADVRNVFAMTSALERHGAQVSYADNVQGGLALIDGEPNMAALLVDAGLAGVNHYELVRHLRVRQPTQPCIAVAAQPSPAEREQCLRAGVSHYIGRPCHPSHLISVLRVARAG